MPLKASTRPIQKKQRTTRPSLYRPWRRAWSPHLSAGGGALPSALHAPLSPARPAPRPPPCTAPLGPSRPALDRRRRRARRGYLHADVRKDALRHSLSKLLHPLFGQRHRVQHRCCTVLGGGSDLISALPDDLLLLVLACLPCACAAVRTGVLSRRWRGLWARLHRIVLRDVPFDFLEPVLARVHRPPPTVSLLEIRLPEPQLADTARLNSLLRAAALLDPKEFLFVFPSGLVHGRHVLDLPCFHHATSIVLNLFSPVHSYDNYPIIGRDLPEGVEFPALETLSMSHCYLHDTDAHDCELVVGGTCLNHVNIVAPKLMQLTISFSTDQEYAVNISISAPMVEKLSWGCHFSKDSMFGLWWLQHLSLQEAERQGQPPSLQIHACIEDIEKRLIAAFSDLELNLDTKGHSYGAFVSHVLEVNQIRCAIQRLKVDLRRSVMEEGCLPDCLCEPTDWKTQTIPLTALEEVDISGFDEKDHGFDFLKLILRSAPMLKRMTIRMSQEASTSNDGFTKMYNIFKDYSSVLCNVYLSSDEYLQHDQHQE